MRASYLQDGDVPREALHGLVQFPALQALLQRQLVQALVELHGCRREAASRVKQEVRLSSHINTGRGEENGRKRRKNKDKPGSRMSSIRFFQCVLASARWTEDGRLLRTCPTSAFRRLCLAEPEQDRV